MQRITFRLSRPVHISALERKNEKSSQLSRRQQNIDYEGCTKLRHDTGYRAVGDTKEISIIYTCRMHWGRPTNHRTKIVSAGKRKWYYRQWRNEHLFNGTLSRFSVKSLKKKLPYLQERSWSPMAQSFYRWQNSLVNSQHQRLVEVEPLRLINRMESTIRRSGKTSPLQMQRRKCLTKKAATKWRFLLFMPPLEMDFSKWFSSWSMWDCYPAHANTANYWDKLFRASAKLNLLALFRFSLKEREKKKNKPEKCSPKILSNRPKLDWQRLSSLNTKRTTSFYFARTTAN